MVARIASTLLQEFVRRHDMYSGSRVAPGEPGSQHLWDFLLGTALAATTGFDLQAKNRLPAMPEDDQLT